MPLSKELKDISDIISRDLRSGQGTRTTVGSEAVAYGWTTGLPQTVANYVTTLKAKSMTFATHRVAASATTPVTIVPPAGPKPQAIELTPGTVTLEKHSGVGRCTLEDTLSGEGLLAAVASVLGAGCLLSFEAAAIAKLDAQAGQTATGAAGDWASGVTAGQAAVIGMGGNPGLAVISYLDWAGFVDSLAGKPGFSVDPSSATGVYMGTAMHISPKAPAGKVFVLDPSSVAAIEHEASPILISNPWSDSGTNQISLIADLLAVVEVLNPQHVVEVTLSATAAAESSSKKK